MKTNYYFLIYDGPEREFLKSPDHKLVPVVGLDEARDFGVRTSYNLNCKLMVISLVGNDTQKPRIIDSTNPIILCAHGKELTAVEFDQVHY